MKIAIIGSGIAGLTCAWRLAGHHQVTLFEAASTLAAILRQWMWRLRTGVSRLIAALSSITTEPIRVLWAC